MELRTFIDALSRHGLLTRVTREVDWKFELGALVRSHRGPLLFENVKDYPGARVFANGISGLVAIGLALGLPSGISRKDLVHELQRRRRGRFKPQFVNSGPVMENFLAGDEIDLFRLPVPHWHPSDAGRYIGTWHVNASRDPDTGCRNLGVYRMELLGPRLATISTYQSSHLGMHVAKAERQGRPLEVAVVIGAPECVVMAGAAALPNGQDEYELAGALEQQSIELVPCRTIKMEVPASAEIVIEGVIRPRERVNDGPYFDYLAQPTSNPSAFLFEASGLMFRNQPIFRGASIGVPGAEDQQLFVALAYMGLWDFKQSAAKRSVQSFLLKRGMFRAFMVAGRIHL